MNTTEQFVKLYDRQSNYFTFSDFKVEGVNNPQFDASAYHNQKMNRVIRVGASGLTLVTRK